MRLVWIVAVTLSAVLYQSGIAAQGSSRYKPAVPPYSYAFPRDHGAHPDYRTEWWYYTGHLASGDRTLGFELTFFQVGVNPSRRMGGSAWSLHTMFFAHFAVTDETGGRFYHTEKIGRPTLGMGGSSEKSLHVWIHDWSAQLLDDGITHRLRANGPNTSLALDLVSQKQPVIHGKDGVSQKSVDVGKASHYYSLTRLETTGTISLSGVDYQVTGLSWMDHEFGTNQLTTRQEGWDWFSIQLDDETDIMLYVLRLKDGTIEPASSGTLVHADGTWRNLDLTMYAIHPTGLWTSPYNGAEYPSGWAITVPSDRIDLTLTPTVQDQELVSRSILGITYWEGSVSVAGSRGGTPVRGKGYVELTGYTGKLPEF